MHISHYRGLFGKLFSSSGRISVHFDNINLKLSAHTYFKMHFHVCQNMEILKNMLDDVITDEKIGRAKGLDLLSVLEEPRVLDK